MHKKIRRSKEEASRLVAEWKASGLSARVFATQEGVPVSTLYQWARRSRTERVIEEPSRGVGHDFLAFEVSDPAATAERACFRIFLQHEREIHVPRGFDADELARLLTILEA